MTAFNAVRFRVKPGMQEQFIAAHRAIDERFPGARRVSLFKTGDQTFCIVGEWSSMNALAKARPKMIGLLDSFRHMLEDLGSSLGVTDPVSGEVVVDRKFAKAKPRAVAKKSAKEPVKKTGAKARRR